MTICPVTKFIVPVTKQPLFPRLFAPLWPRGPTFEFGLHVHVKFCPDPLRFVRVIREKPILSKYICMTAYK